MQPENVPTRALRISITGVVQGVGFRPFVYNLARRLGVRGWVLNHSGGVDIEAEAEPETLTAFLAALRAEAPPLAHIASLEATPIPSNGYTTFEIRHSEAQEGRFVLISPDVATCPDCLRELFDPSDRRYRYPFINCTNCGPRFTIITDIPYDRPHTTMRVFPLCDACRAEYENPADRRFHAQPNACPECGPHLTLLAQGAATAAGALADAVERLLQGEIVAVKGLGGFQLACDATAAEAVQRLRERKHRPHKPFAVMVASLEEARLYCEISPEEAALLTSPQAPIVLLRRRTPDGAVGRAPVAPEVAPNQHTLGLMLPYTPLHHLLLRDVGRPLVMTSGNLSEEPIAKDNDEALERLADIADAFLLHDRDIYARYDDSVVQVSQFANPKSGSLTPKLQVVRRARGYAPFPIPLPFEVGQVFAAGPLLKNTFTLTRERYAFVSQHIGDLENLETLEHYEAALATYQRLFRIAPERVVCDLHPDYLSTRFAEDFARAHGLPDLRVVLPDDAVHRAQSGTRVAGAVVEDVPPEKVGRVLHPQHLLLTVLRPEEYRTLPVPRGPGSVPAACGADQRAVLHAFVADQFVVQRDDERVRKMMPRGEKKRDFSLFRRNFVAEADTVVHELFQRVENPDPALPAGLPLGGCEVKVHLTGNNGVHPHRGGLFDRFNGRHGIAAENRHVTDLKCLVQQHVGRVAHRSVLLRVSVGDSS